MRGNREGDEGAGGVDHAFYLRIEGENEARKGKKLIY
jgi:hypothetical protein